MDAGVNRSSAVPAAKDFPLVTTNGIWAALTGAALFLLALLVTVQALSHLAWGWVVVFWLVLAAPVALVPAWVHAVRQGHEARLARGALRGWIFRGGLRITLAGVGGLIAVALLVLYLGRADPLLWLVATTAVLLPVALLPRLAAPVAGSVMGPHALRAAIWLSVRLSVAAAVALHLLLGALVVPAVDGAQSFPVPVSALVGEGLILARLWAGMEAFVLGRAAEFGTWGWLVAALGMTLGLVGVYFALALGGVAAALGSRELGRGLAPASDEISPPSPGRAGLMAAAVLALGLGLGVALAERGLTSIPSVDRPAAQLQTGAERIGDALYRAGTWDQIQALRAATLAEDDAANARLAEALNTAFDAMVANVDLFLDGYYTLWADYMRLFASITFGLEQHLADKLEEGLTSGAPFAAFEALRDSELAAIAARHRELLQQEAALLDAARLSDTINPALLRVAEGRFALPDFDERLQADLTRAQARWAVSVGAGAMSFVIAQRVVTRLAERGLLRIAAQALTRIGGVLVAFGVDYALVKLDEYQNRDTFRAEILAEIERLRSDARAGLQR